MKRMFRIGLFVLLTAVGSPAFSQMMGGLMIPSLESQYPAGSVFCASGPTAIVEVTNPTTGKVWMDRNLGASQAATSSTDAAAYGDLYQWGRRSDGHQCRTSPTTATLSTTDQPAHGDFIPSPSSPNDWRTPQNANLWQGVNGVNNPCPIGYRIPTETELDSERLSWNNNNATGAFASPLKLPMAGYRNGGTGALFDVGIGGGYWSSTPSILVSRSLPFNSIGANINTNTRAGGLSVRCIKEISATLGALNCGSANTTGTLTAGQPATGVSTSVPYTGGNAGNYSAQAVSSTGVTGLNANLAAGSVNNGTGNLLYTITGTPSAAGTASFAISLGGQSCTFTIAVAANLAAQYPAGSVFCASGPTAIVEVTNPTTGRVWMDRNLGASQAATSSNDAAAYGDLYQWGRRSDGHQCRNSVTTSALSSTDQPAHGSFILAPNSPNDWRSPQNSNLWQGVNGVNNPCPSGYRVPTSAEFEAERLSWSQNNSAGAFASPVKLPAAGNRGIDGSFSGVNTRGYYWSSMVSSNLSRYLYFLSFGASTDNTKSRANGDSVRCIKN
jgi:uncharacterized protein (TIGR02145 family)